MPIRTELTARLDLAHPIIQAPMAGGATTAALVAEACNAGALGSIAAAYLDARQIAELAAAVRARTTRPFGINLFAPLPPPAGAAIDAGRALARVAPFYRELGLPAPTMPAWGGELFDETLAAALESGASVLSFTFGLLPPAAVRAIRARGLFLIGTATTVDEARALEASGVDAICAQGSEAGGHRGTFLPQGAATPTATGAAIGTAVAAATEGNSSEAGMPPPLSSSPAPSRENAGSRGAAEATGAASFEAGQIGTMALTPQMVDAVRVPVIAAGGIMDGRGIAAALALGASAAQLGTAFLTCDESGIAEVYKQAILAACEDQTRVTRAFSGRPARSIVNRFMNIVDGRDTASPGDEDAGTEAVLPFPLQAALARPLRAAAMQAGRSDLLSLFAGQGIRLARRQSAAALVSRLAAETDAALRRLTPLA